jgi:hypothetical protein
VSRYFQVLYGFFLWIWRSLITSPARTSSGSGSPAPAPAQPWRRQGRSARGWTHAASRSNPLDRTTDGLASVAASAAGAGASSAAGAASSSARWCCLLVLLLPPLPLPGAASSSAASAAASSGTARTGAAV